jgi:hypothetical protein
MLISHPASPAGQVITMESKRFPILRAMLSVLFGIVLIGLLRILQPIIRHALRVSGYQHWVSSEH